jgi:hypothetical protein
VSFLKDFKKSLRSKGVWMDAEEYKKVLNLLFLLRTLIHDSYLTDEEKLLINKMAKRAKELS